MIPSYLPGVVPADLRAVLPSWMTEDLKKGVQYKVVMRIGERFSGTALEDLQDQGISALRNRFKSVKVNAMTEKTIDLVVYADPAEYPDAFAVYSAIRHAMASLAQAKKNKDWASADLFRNQIEELGYTVKDTPAGPSLQKKM